MTTEFVLAYVSRKMRSEGVGENYALAFRELVIKGKQKIEIDAAGQFYYLVAGFSAFFSVTSENGVYDLSQTNTNEQAHEHFGKIVIENREDPTLLLQFIIAIPNH